ELAAGLRRKEFSSEELCRHFLGRISKYKALNAFITVDEARTLASAQAADAALAKGQAGALAGIPIAQKDIFCADGWLTTCGSKILANFTAPYDATAIARFNDAGAGLRGQTHTAE